MRPDHNQQIPWFLAACLTAILLLALLSGYGSRGRLSHTAPISEIGRENPAQANQVESLLSPLPLSLMHGGTFTASFDNKDIVIEDGVLKIYMIVYDYERFAAADISRMKVGDTLSVNGQSVLVDVIEHRENGGVMVNGGIELVQDGDVFYVVAANAEKCYQMLGSATLLAAQDFTFYDYTGLAYSAEELLTLADSIDFSCPACCASAEVKNGFLVSVTRMFAPDRS